MLAGSATPAGGLAPLPVWPALCLPAALLAGGSPPPPPPSSASPPALPAAPSSVYCRSSDMMVRLASARMTLPRSYSSTMRWYVAAPLPNAKSMTRSMPPTVTLDNRLERMCFRSFITKPPGTVGLSRA